MPGLNPNLIGSAPSPTHTPTDAALDAAESAVLPVTQRDYPRIYKLLILANTVMWVSYIMGWIK